MAIGELKCPSLDYVYDMTWAEFMIRLFAYRRQNKEQWYMVREIAYNALIAPNANPKKLPKNKEAYMSLDGKKQQVSDLMLERIRKAQSDYQKEISVK